MTEPFSISDEYFSLHLELLGRVSQEHSLMLSESNTQMVFFPVGIGEGGGVEGADALLFLPPPPPQPPA